MALPDSTLNLSMLRAPLPSTSPSASSSLPPLDLPFAPLRQQMALFTQKFDNYISQSRASILQSRTNHHLSRTTHSDTLASTAADLASMREKLSTQKRTLANQDTETRELAEAVESLREERDERAARVDEVRDLLEGVKHRVAQRRKERRERGEYITSQRGLNEVELEEWERVLGVRVEGLNEDGVARADDEERVRFVFSVGAQGKGAHGREVNFVLDLSGRSGRAFEVVETRPKVESARVEEVVRGMCESEELGVFLKGMRGLLIGR